MRHLEQLAPEMFAMLERADDPLLRTVCLQACEYAVFHNRLRDPIVHAALNALRAGQPYRQEDTRQLEALMNVFDERYFELKDLAEDEEDESRRETLTLQYRDYFQKARTVAALLSAADEDGFEAASEAIYEAAASTPNKAALFELVKQFLTSRSA